MIKWFKGLGLYVVKFDMFLENFYYDIRGFKLIEMFLVVFGVCILEVLRGKVVNICLILESSKVFFGIFLRFDYIESC